jgi:hypothetical protein
MPSKTRHTLIGTLAELLVAGGLLDEVEDGLGQFVGGKRVRLGVDIGGRLRGLSRGGGGGEDRQTMCAIKRTWRSNHFAYT